MPYYVVKYIVPVAIPASKEVATNPQYFSEDDQIITDRMNILDRDYLIFASTISQVLMHLVSNAGAEIEPLHGVPVDNGAGYQLPLMINRWYVIGIYSPKGKIIDYAFMPTISGTPVIRSLASMGKVGDIIAQGVYTPNTSVMDSVLNPRCSEAMLEGIRMIKEQKFNSTPGIAHALKATKGEWILKTMGDFASV